MLRYLLELAPPTGGRLRVAHDGSEGRLVLIASDGSGVVAMALELEAADVAQLVSVTSLWLGVQPRLRAASTELQRATVQG